RVRELELSRRGAAGEIKLQRCAVSGSLQPDPSRPAGLAVGGRRNVRAQERGGAPGARFVAGDASLEQPRGVFGKAIQGQREAPLEVAPVESEAGKAGVGDVPRSAARQEGEPQPERQPPVHLRPTTLSQASATWPAMRM